nr:AraC family transcriptional regulator N-terminal domain-containing protein [Pseudomonadota bacterium]
MLTNSPVQACHSVQTDSASPAIAALSDAVRKFAKTEGVTPSPLGSVWALKLSECLPYHRGRNKGLSVAVAVSGLKRVCLGDKQIVNDPGHVIAFHGDASYSAVVEGTPAKPYLALKLQLSPELIAQTLVRLAETDAHASSPAKGALISCEPLDDELAG